MNFINQLFENLKKRKVYSSFKGNIWGVDLADIQSLSKYNKWIKYLLCAIDLFSKGKKGTSIINAFQKIISKKKENQIKYGLIKVVNFTINLLKIF